MILRRLCVALAVACLQGCITYSPEASTPVRLEDALKIVARDLNKASPVVLSDIHEDGKSPLKEAIRARQCATSQADPPLPVITGPVSLQLQGQIQGQVQGGAGIGTASFQVQATRSQQQQLTIPITFVPASALANFFLGQNVPNVSGIPKKADMPKGYDGDDSVSLILKLVGKASAITNATKSQIDAFQNLKKDAKGNVEPDALKTYCTDVTNGVDLTLISADISVIIPEGLRSSATF